MPEVAWIRWFMVGFFALAGVWLITNRGRFAQARAAFCSVCLHEPAQARLVSAYERREQTEAIPGVLLGGGLGALAFFLALLAALTPAPVQLLYAVFQLALAVTLTFAYGRLGRTHVRRFASLVIRDPNAIAPWYAWTLVAVTAVLPLLWISLAPAASILVAAAGMTMAVLARRVGSLPALLSGEDIIVETFVDKRLRVVRGIDLLSIAVLPSLVFEAFTGYTDSLAHVGAMVAALLAFAVAYRQVFVSRRRPSPNELSAWMHAAT